MCKKEPKSVVYNSDCLEAMRLMPDKCFELAIVDPEYGINVGKQRINSNRSTAKWASPKEYSYKTFDDSTPPSAEYFCELFRVSVNQIIWGGNYFSEHLPASMGWVVWDKLVDEKEHLSMVEMAWTSFERRAMKFSYLWAGFKKAEQITRIHPTQKPVRLYKWLLQNYAKEGDRILDTHMGSQSSRIAAYQMGFDYQGYEIDADYFRDGCKRFDLAIQQLSIF